MFNSSLWTKQQKTKIRLHSDSADIEKLLLVKCVVLLCCLQMNTIVYFCINFVNGTACEKTVKPKKTRWKKNPSHYVIIWHCLINLIKNERRKEKKKRFIEIHLYRLQITLKSHVFIGNSNSVCCMYLSFFGLRYALCLRLSVFLVIWLYGAFADIRKQHKVSKLSNRLCITWVSSIDYRPLLR